MGIVISAASYADRDDVIALWQTADLTRPWNDPIADFNLAIEGPTSAILIARSDEVIVGCVMAGFDGHRGWVYYLASHPRWRGQGIGRELMRAAEEWLKERGAPKIQLMIRGDNEIARGFYAALGYEVQDVVTIGRRLD